MRKSLGVTGLDRGLYKTTALWTRRSTTTWPRDAGMDYQEDKTRMCRA